MGPGGMEITNGSNNNVIMSSNGIQVYNGGSNRYSVDISSTNGIKINGRPVGTTYYNTASDFKVIREKILEIAKNNKDNIDVLVQKIIEKAWVEPKYIETYAQLCYFLQNEKSLDDSETKRLDGSKRIFAKNFFKNKLLDKIQKAFETEEVEDQKLKG